MNWKLILYLLFAKINRPLTRDFEEDYIVHRPPHPAEEVEGNQTIVHHRKVK
jgi:hypothetical protein